MVRGLRLMAHEPAAAPLTVPHGSTVVVAGHERVLALSPASIISIEYNTRTVPQHLHSPWGGSGLVTQVTGRGGNTSSLGAWGERTTLYDGLRCMWERVIAFGPWEWMIWPTQLAMTR